jgi:hypothetical protein
MDDDASENFTSEKDENTSIYVIHNFRINYQNKSNNLNNISAYEFASRFYKVPNLRYLRLLEDHPQHTTHTIHEYRVPRNQLYKDIKFHHLKTILKRMRRQCVFCFLHGACF